MGGGGGGVGVGNAQYGQIMRGRDLPCSLAAEFVSSNFCV